jgi:hypothetical protein
MSLQRWQQPQHLEKQRQVPLTTLQQHFLALQQQQHLLSPTSSRANSSS